MRRKSQGTWQILPSLGVPVTHWQEPHTQVIHGAGMKLITCFQKGAALVSSSFQYVSQHNAKCSHWSTKLEVVGNLATSSMTNTPKQPQHFPVSFVLSIWNSRKVDSSNIFCLSKCLPHLITQNLQLKVEGVITLALVRFCVQHLTERTQFKG